MNSWTSLIFRMPLSILAWPTARPPGSVEKLELNTAPLAGARPAQASMTPARIRPPNRHRGRGAVADRADTDVEPEIRRRPEPREGTLAASGWDGVFMGYELLVGCLGSPPQPRAMPTSRRSVIRTASRRVTLIPGPADFPPARL